VSNTAGGTPPGWYDDGHGNQRWWDGRGWTEYTQPTVPNAAQRLAPQASAPAAPPVPVQAAPGPEAPAAATQTAPAVSGRRRSRLALVALILAIAALVLGLIPFLGFLTWIPAAVAIVLAIIALARKSQRGMAVGALIAGAIAVFSGPVESGAAVAALAGHAQAASVAPASTAAAAAPASTAPAAAAPSPSPTPTPTPKPKPVAKILKSFSGSGDDVIRVNYSDPVIVAFSCANCDSNTVLESDSGMNTLLVNTIGSYSGRHLVNTSDGDLLTKLKITADAHWALQIENPSAAITTKLDNVGQTVSGTGDDVIYVGDSVGDVKIVNHGDDNFVVEAYGDQVEDTLVVNQIGSYSGTDSLQGPAVVQVTSGGHWTMTGEQ
jgi:hypothetical protein